MEETKKDVMPLVSLIMGLLGLLTFCCCYGGLIFGSLAVIFAMLSRTGEPMAGTARAGLILGIIAIVLTFVLFGVLIIFAALDGAFPVPEQLMPEFLMIGSLLRSGGGV